MTSMNDDNDGGNDDYDNDVDSSHESTSTSSSSSSSSSPSAFCTEFHQPLNGQTNNQQSASVATSGSPTEFGFAVDIDCSGNLVVVGTAGDPSAVFVFYKQQPQQDGHPEKGDGEASGGGEDDGDDRRFLSRSRRSSSSSSRHNHDNHKSHQRPPHGQHVHHNQHKNDEDDGVGKSQYKIKTFHNPLWSWSVGTSNFGITVKVTSNGERLLIGDSIAGRVYLYDGLQGHLIHTFVDPVSLKTTKPSGDEFFTNFGGSIDMTDDGTVVVIGASSSNMPSKPSVRAAGAVYVYRLQEQQHHQDESMDGGGTGHGHNKWRKNDWNKWSDPIVLEEMHGQVNDNFGISVSVLKSENEDSSDLTNSANSLIRVLVGGYNANQGRGAALLYVLTDGEDTTDQQEVAKIEPTLKDSDDEVISDDDGQDGGAARTTKRKRPYRLIRTYISPDLQHSLGFGFAVDMTEEFVVIGARGAGVEKVPEAGAVYVYQTASPPSSWDFLNDNSGDIDNGDDDDTDLNHSNSKNMHIEPLEGQLLSVLTTIHQPRHVEKQNQFGGALAIQGRRLLIASLGDGTAYSYDLVDEPRGEDLKQSILTAKLIGRHAVAANPFAAGASVALSGDGRFGVLGAPRALGKRGRIQGGAYGLCLPHVVHSEHTRGSYEDLFNTASYTCPATHLPAVPWYSTQYWSSWDSWSGKALSLTITILISLCLLFCKNEGRLPHSDLQRRNRRRPRRNRRTSRQEQQLDEDDEVQILMQHQSPEIEMVEDPFRPATSSQSTGTSNNVNQ